MNAEVIAIEKKRSPVPAATGGYLGDMVAWQLGDSRGEFSADREILKALFAEAGFAGAFDESRADPTAALCEAARTAHVGRHLIVKQLAKPNKDTPVAFCVYQRQARDEGGDELVPGARVRIVNDVPTAFDPEGKPGIQICLDLAIAIQDRARALMTTVHNQELSEALRAAGDSLMWARFRRAGGVYWLLAHKAAQYRGLLDAVETLARANECGFYATVQPLFGDDDGRTIRNVSEAAASTITDELAELQTDLEQAKNGKIGKRAIESRIVRCQELLIRADLYQEVLEARAGLLANRSNEMREKFSALLTTDPKKDIFDF